MTTNEILKRAKAASVYVAAADKDKKNASLRLMAEKLVEATDAILEANSSDVEAARGRISDVMIDRLLLSRERIEGMAKGILDAVELPDPVWRTLTTVERPGGLVIKKVSVPLGVVAIIYESRPNVTSDAASLAVKSGNACVLRCGKEAHASAAAIVDALQNGLAAAGLPKDSVLLIEDTTRESANEMMKARGLIDLLIPRGGKGLIKSCVENATVPCIETGTGICHVYVDRYADLDKALKIVNNAKTSRPSVCNAEEVLIVHKDIAEEFLPRLEKILVDERIAAGTKPVELRCDTEALPLVKSGVPAGEADFDTEFLDYILAVKTVSSAEKAIEHISLHSTGHSDAIVTEDEDTARLFTSLVDSAAVYVNASTRFTDGGEFGLGCEMGISTQKLHARGPMGLEELTSYKYVITGNGNVR
ncbi:MAG: glutamate-5-semialdehyde dehydrogenase [Clostridia bacterium]|nr:glutamate-5-semialdehyde dehydrogenase [Clostridia bacterium]MBQ9879954.1 glutamate-5-semialdehyde dehydrogenase [Clostridia bacterium]